MSFVFKNHPIATGYLLDLIDRVPNRADFSLGVNFCGLTLNPRFNCAISLDFTPSATGTRTAPLSIESDTTPGTQSVQLAGTGQ